MTVWQKITDIANAVGDAGNSVLDDLAHVFGLGRNAGKPENDVAFTIGVIALSAKMAKADGTVTSDEISAFRDIIKVPAGEMGMTSADRARKQSMDMIQSLQSVPEIKPVSNQITSLKMNNQPPRVLYETVGKLAGINVLFDPQMQPGRNSNLDLSNVTLNEALAPAEETS